MLDGGAALVAVLGDHLVALLDDDLADLVLLVGEDELVALDARHDLPVLLLDLVALEAGELLELHFEDGGGLDVVEAEALEHAGLGLLVVARGADDVDDFVDVVDGDAEAFEQVGALPGLAEDDMTQRLAIPIAESSQVQPLRIFQTTGYVPFAESAKTTSP